MLNCPSNCIFIHKYSLGAAICRLKLEDFFPAEPLPHEPVPLPNPQHGRVHLEKIHRVGHSVLERRHRDLGQAAGLRQISAQAELRQDQLLAAQEEPEELGCRKFRIHSVAECRGKLF